MKTGGIARRGGGGRSSRRIAIPCLNEIWAGRKETDGFGWGGRRWRRHMVGVGWGGSDFSDKNKTVQLSEAPAKEPQR